MIMSDQKKEIKCVIWDLDNTIWDGVLLEDENVTLNPEIINILEILDQRGILNSIASKNNYNHAMEKLIHFGIDKYFLYPQINWNAKSSSIQTIQNHLNIGMDSFLFIDDQEYELDEVKDEIPDIICLNALNYRDMLNIPILNPRFITEDSKRRRQMYLDDFKRKTDEEDFIGPSESFLSSLNMKFMISEAKEEDLKRAEELTIRTNQLNATGRTYDYNELNYFRVSQDHKLLVCELVDRYGSYGKIGLALIELKNTHWHLRLLLMSCRVISRGVGSVLMLFIMNEAKKLNKKLLADFKKTDKNKMMYVSYKFANFKEIEINEGGVVLLENDLSLLQPYPQYIEMIAV